MDPTPQSMSQNTRLGSKLALNVLEWGSDLSIDRMVDF